LIRGNPVECTITIYNLSGQQVLADRRSLEYGPNTINLLKDMSPGMYLLEIITSTSNEKLKFIIR